MSQVERLQARIDQLEFRLSLIEKYLDADGVLLLKNDKSQMDHMRISIKDDMKKSGKEISSDQMRLGGKFYPGDL